MPPPAVDKVIVTHKAALDRKYQPAGLRKIETAVAKLVAEDAKRGLNTVVADLASAADAKKMKFAAVPLARVAQAKPHKQAVDKIYAHFNRPAYLMILGGPDVVPHVPLKNPLYHLDADGDGESDDPDATVDSDLPYACDAAYATDVRKFISPTRTVGRLPDVLGGDQEGYLVGLLETAANYTDRPAVDYKAYFGLSTKTWKKSTQLSLTKLFGGAADLQLSPPVEPPGTPAKHLARLAHFINCHGAPGSPQFFGEDKFGQPVALDAADLAGKLREGTVAAAECCYGAMLYDPDAFGEPIGMANTYLREKAYGFLGSSTISYGPEDQNELADLVCRFFLRHVADGASIGRSCLQARLDYVQSLKGTVTAHDLKTLAQFHLMGDPAVTPVHAPASPTIVKQVSVARTVPKGLAGEAAAALAGFVVERVTRDDRRAWLRTYSSLLSSVAECVTEAVVDTAFAAAAKGDKAPGGVSKENQAVGRRLRELAEEMKLDDPTVMLFGMPGTAPGGPGPEARPGLAGPKGMPKASTVEQRVHVVMERVDAGDGDAPRKTVLIRGFEAIEYEGVLEVRKFVSR